MLHARADSRPETAASADGPTLDESSPEVQALLARIAPICEVLYLTMVADDDAEAEELESIRGAIVTLTAGALSADTIDAMLRRYASAAAEQGRDERLAQVAAQLSADREDAEATLVLAAAVAVSDGLVEGPEEHLLQRTLRLARHLERPCRRRSRHVPLRRVHTSESTKHSEARTPSASISSRTCERCMPLRPPWMRGTRAGFR